MPPAFLLGAILYPDFNALLRLEKKAPEHSQLEAICIVQCPQVIFIKMVCLPCNKLCHWSGPAMSFYNGLWYILPQCVCESRDLRILYLLDCFETLTLEALVTVTVNKLVSELDDHFLPCEQMTMHFINQWSCDCSYLGICLLLCNGLLFLFFLNNLGNI